MQYHLLYKYFLLFSVLHYNNSYFFSNTAAGETPTFININNLVVYLAIQLRLQKGNVAYKYIYRDIIIIANIGKWWLGGA